MSVHLNEVTPEQLSPLFSREEEISTLIKVKYLIMHESMGLFSCIDGLKVS